MKKLLMFFGMALVLAFSAGNASAVSFGLDIGADGTIDDPAEVTIFLSETIDIDIYIVDWDSLGNPGQPLGALDYQFTWDATKVAVAGIVLKDLKPNGSALWDAEGQYPNGNYVDLSVIEYGVGVSGTPIRLHTITLHCIAIGDAAIGVGNAYAVDTLGDDTTPVDPAAGVIHQTVPVCECEITPDSATLNVSSASVDFDAAEVVPANCDNAPDYTFTDDCGQGDVNAVTGIFTATDFTATENCTVTATDNANTTAPSVQVVCTADVTIELEELCKLEIYKGGAPVPPLNTYSMPGRRGLALTCGDTVQFDYCTDCDGANPGQSDPCPVFSSVGGPAGTNITVDGLLTIGDCEDVDYPMDVVVTVTDPCNGGISDDVTVIVGEVVLIVENGIVATTIDGLQVAVSLDNPDHAVKAIQITLRDDANLVCTSCAPDPDRALNFTCTANENLDGNCAIMLVSMIDQIAQGSGVVLTVDYDAVEVVDEDCINVWIKNGENVADRFGDPLCVCKVDGTICFQTCGDLYPMECLPDDPVCGDGVVDIFDILEAIDIALEIQVPTDCQSEHGDVPTGTPPYCSPPDGGIDIFDVLVIIDMALGKANCCDYYNSGSII